MLIKVKKGKNIPFSKIIHHDLKDCTSAKKAGIYLEPLSYMRFVLHKKVGDKVKIGEPVLADASVLDRQFVSPIQGTITDIVRGEKRKLIAVLIEKEGEEFYAHQPVNIETCTKDNLLSLWAASGVFSQIKMRPCDVLAKIDTLPKSIFIKAVESAAYLPSPHLEVEKFKEDFLFGIKALRKLGVPIHVVHDGQQEIFNELQGVSLHTVKGPVPASNPSVHIYHIDPVYDITDIRWTLTTHDVICIGKVTRTGTIHHQTVIALVGDGVPEEKNGLYLVNKGICAQELHLFGDATRVISGDPLRGSLVGNNGVLGMNDVAFSIVPEAKEKREWLHFFRLGWNKFTLTNTYLSALKASQSGVSFDTHQHGENRAFVDTEIYDKVFPLKIPVVLLVKALIAKDYEKAIKLGLLEVASEDFALPTFICPSKIDMVSIVKEGLQKVAEQYI